MIGLSKLIVVPLGKHSTQKAWQLTLHQFGKEKCNTPHRTCIAYRTVPKLSKGLRKRCSYP
eukprot:scaffold582401_cov20-Prasinocladus_malaysianus.AAC.1